MTTSHKENCKRLMDVVKPIDTLGILILADPDAMASALALKRIYWRKAKKVNIYHINSIKRPDNLAFIKLLKIEQQHIRHIKPREITKWAIVDSQPHHHKEFMNYTFDIIIDHHPADNASTGEFVDIQENYGATSAIMTEYMKAAGIIPSERLATALLYGIKTDTDNFVKSFVSNDINAFRYLCQLANMNILKKIESSEITRQTLTSYRFAIDHLKIINDIAFVHMNGVKNPDTLVIIADFFMKLAEVTWSVVSGIYNKNLIVIFRNSGFGNDAGKVAQDLFGKWGGSAGGHREAARAELPLEKLPKITKGKLFYANFVKKHLAAIK